VFVPDTTHTKVCLDSSLHFKLKWSGLFQVEVEQSLRGAAVEVERQLKCMVFLTVEVERPF